ncbi:response regulator [Tumebacillus algifaecis]|uniref:response regulator n=1 Tax=Tumebacillus algifaecis TaxID=1214604 RepID=UPI001D130D6C|nr:response regulator transcription factor [Tumebacillus algifaecis]
MSHLRIVLADDQVLLRDALKTIINLEDDMEVIATAGNGLEAFEKAKELQPDLVLMDIKMPGVNGIEGITIIKKHLPEMKVLILTTFDEEDFIVEGLLKGAVGYLLKDIQGDKLIQSIREAVNGQLMLPVQVANRLAARLHHLSTPEQKSAEEERSKRRGFYLTDREREVAVLMVQGLKNRQIADALFMSEGTVKNYVSVIYSKVGIHDRATVVTLLQEMLEEDGPATSAE